MKKTLFVVAAGFIGLASAVAGNYRTAYEYANILDTGNYTLKTPFNEADCSVPSQRVCHYTYNAVSPLPSPISAATLVAAGAIPSTIKAKVQ